MFEEYVMALQAAFKDPKCRSYYLKLLEHDYQSYKLNFKRPEDIDQRNVRVCLPSAIYDNLLESFHLFLDALKPDLLTTDSREGVEQLLRLMLFAKLFNIEIPVKGWGSVLRRIQQDLDTASVWQINNIWLEIAKYRMQDITQVDKPSAQEASKETSKEATPDEKSESSRASTVEESVERNTKACIEILF